MTSTKKTSVTKTIEPPCGLPYVLPDGNVIPIPDGFDRRSAVYIERNDRGSVRYTWVAQGDDLFDD